MLEINRDELIERIWDITVFSVVKRIQGIFRCEKSLLLEFEIRETIDRVASEEYDKVKHCFNSYYPGHISKQTIKEYIQSIGLMDGQYYYEVLLGELIYGVMGSYGEDSVFVKDVFVSPEKYSEEDVEYLDGLYIHETKEIQDYDLINCIESLGAEVYVEEPTEEECMESCDITVFLGDLNIILGDFDFLFGIQNESGSKRLEVLIDYFFKRLIKMEGENNEIAIIKDGISENKLVYFKKTDDVDEREAIIIKEISNAAMLIIVSNILVRELKKEGYLIE